MEKRLRVFMLFVTIIFVALIVRLFYWQVIASESLRALSERQRTASFEIPAKRGQIFASDGSPIVVNQRAYLVYVEPQKVKRIADVITSLSDVLLLDKASVSAQLVDTKALWVPIKHHVEEHEVVTIKDSKIEGVGFLDEPKRYYPEASMAAHLLGFVGKNSKGEDRGYFGIEGYYDEQLRGRSGLLRQETDALGHPILSGNMEEVPPDDGRDIYLTIDRTIQYIVETKLKEGIEKYKAAAGTVIILEPLTGKVLAMASFPSYHPGDFSMYANDLYKNPAVAASFEPGSTFKVLVAAGAIDDGVVRSDTVFNEEGPVQIGGYSIKTWNQKYHGNITLTQILEYSSNVGMVYVGKSLGTDELVTYIKKLGFGNLTNIDLQDESSPAIRPEDQWYDIDYATVSFGQGIAVTPLQMVCAVGAIANGGNLMKPYIVSQVKMKNGKTITTQPEIVQSVYKKETASVVTEMMVSAVEHGDAKWVKPIGYRIAGKTGTAQIPISGHYDAQKTIASFVGFAPAEKPMFVMLVTIREPTTSPWGSETAAPLFFTIAREIFSYLGVSPSM